MPDFLNFPPSTAPTLSFAPIFDQSSLLPLKAKDKVGGATFSSAICVSALITSSGIASLRFNSSSGDGLSLRNGSTAMDFSTMVTGRRANPLFTSGNMPKTSAAPTATTPMSLAAAHRRRAAR